MSYTIVRHKLTLVLGHEDLVVRHSDRWMKVKPEETHDVAIIGFGEDRDKHVGRIGFSKNALREMRQASVSGRAFRLW